MRAYSHKQWREMRHWKIQTDVDKYIPEIPLVFYLDDRMTVDNVIFMMCIDFSLRGASNSLVIIMRSFYIYW